MFGEFTDLIYVAIIIKFADEMKYKQTTAFLYDDALVETMEEKFNIYYEGAILFGALVAHHYEMIKKMKYTNIILFSLLFVYFYFLIRC